MHQILGFLHASIQILWLFESVKDLAFHQMETPAENESTATDINDIRCNTQNDNSQRQQWLINNIHSLTTEHSIETASVWISVQELAPTLLYSTLFIIDDDNDWYNQIISQPQVDHQDQLFFWTFQIGFPLSWHVSWQWRWLWQQICLWWQFHQQYTQPLWQPSFENTQMTNNSTAAKKLPAFSAK